MDKQKLWGILKVALKIGFTALLIYLVFQKIDFKEVKGILLKSNPLFILLAFIFYFISQVAGSWRLLSFLKSIGLDIKFGFNFRLYLLGMFYNIFLPGGIGGDGYKIYILRRRFQLPTKRIFMSLLFDRISGLWAIGLICVALIILIPQINIPLTLPIAALVAGTLIYYMILRRYFADYMRFFVSAHLKSILAQSLQLLTVICILLSQNFAGKFSPYLFSFLVSSLATVIPVSLGGFGIREYVMTHASGVFNMNQTLAVFITLVFSTLSTIAALPGIWFVYRSKEFDPLPNQQEAEEFEEKADVELKAEK